MRDSIGDKDDVEELRGPVRLAMRHSIVDKYDEIVEELCAPVRRPTRRERAKLRDLADGLCKRFHFQVAGLRDDLRRRRIPRLVERGHAREVKRVRQALTMRVRDILGEMSERYKSPHAWVFIPDTKGALRSVFSYRSRMRNQRIRMDERAIISQVARTLRAHAAPDTSKDPFYQECMSSTKSELAVPIVNVGPRAERRLLGVVNFESHELGNFTKDMERPAEIDARELTVPLICLQSLHPEDLGRWPFEPKSLGWSADQLLYKLCYQFTRSLGRENPDVDLSATIWLADWEEMLLWALAPAGYDYEYRLRPLEGPSVTWVGAESPHGCVVRTTPDDPRFKDKEKARRMGMERILSTPIFDDAKAKRAIGTLNVCQFRTIGIESESTRDALPSDEMVVEFANLVGAVRMDFERVRENAACAYLDWKMEVSRFATDRSEMPAAQFHILKEVLRECFAADGCSVFLPDENNEYLDLVSSTGIRGEKLMQHEGRFVVRRMDPMRYPLRDANRRSVMQFLFDNPGMAVVLNSVSDISRHRMLDHGMPEEIYRAGMERLSPDIEERRFLGIGIRGHDRTWVVVRLVRSRENPPFTVADGRLLEALAGLCNRSAYWRPLGGEEASSVTGLLGNQDIAQETFEQPGVER